MEELSQLSAPHCVLLAAHYASEANIAALRTLTALRHDDLAFGLVLRLLLTFLPEALEPARYVPFLEELAANARTPELERLNTDAVRQLSGAQAAKRARKLDVQLQPIEHHLYESETDLDPFSHFLIHRAHRIDAETGLLEFVPLLVTPFLHCSDYLRTWFISTVLPLLRLGYEYYPQKPAPSLENFAQWRGRRAIDTLLSNLRWRPDKGPDVREPTRDLRGVVGPWICGENERKRRKLDVVGEERRASAIEASRVGEDGDDWESLFAWLAETSKEDFALTEAAFADWDGPSDLDLGGFDEGKVYLDDERQGRLERRYAQAALASVYLVESSGVETLQRAHALLVRLCGLLSLDPPPGLDVNIDSLPQCRGNCPISEETPTSVLREENLLQPNSIITQPGDGQVHLLELFIFSAYLLSQLHYPASVRDVARMYLRADTSEQTKILQKIVHTLSSGSRQDTEQWRTSRALLLWLWSWHSPSREGHQHAQGPLGKIEKTALETAILRALIEQSHYPLATAIYLAPPAAERPLPSKVLEQVILSCALQHYDNASNGNRTRGGMKKASDIIAAFISHFPASASFQRAEALLAATHAMSFYSLILQHGVPFTPVNIRVSHDPLALLRKLVAQNRSSYTHLDDLIHIGQNLVIAQPATLLSSSFHSHPHGPASASASASSSWKGGEEEDEAHLDPPSMQKQKKKAERRVIAMAIDAALAAGDFETAYSYVVNRLSPPEVSPAVSPALSTALQKFYFGDYSGELEDEADDVSWRAALQAGKYSPTSISPTSTLSSSAAAAARPDLRRLEQRLELLSQALLLAPPSHLEEVLSEWQACEKSLTALLALEDEAEERFNYAADRRLPGAFLQESVPTVQPRREVGRGVVGEEAPMGLFDVARGAARAFGRTAFPLRAAGGLGLSKAPLGGEDAGTGVVGGGERERVSVDLGSEAGSVHTDDGSASGRVRRRDMLANTVTGGLASGIGWVLGAQPVNHNERDRH